MAGDILDHLGIHSRNDAVGDESFPGGMVGNQFPLKIGSYCKFKLSELSTVTLSHFVLNLAL